MSERSQHRCNFKSEGDNEFPAQYSVWVMEVSIFSATEARSQWLQARYEC
ncbi:hypothetical protein [Vibrio aestuarianus]|nr:hypothetical protein [Vibrio aestuarianus]MDE1208625.1 hypothetical protein [Vibrio aestuarianus]MDE1253185.1 hypothetical protein [Vibrio aestuarianus]